MSDGLKVIEMVSDREEPLAGRAGPASGDGDGGAS